jgi:hypothetical protein
LQPYYQWGAQCQNSKFVDLVEFCSLITSGALSVKIPNLWI